MAWQPNRRQMRAMAWGLAIVLGTLLALMPMHPARKYGAVGVTSPQAGATTLWAVSHDVARRYGEPNPSNLIFVTLKSSSGDMVYHVQMDGHFTVAKQQPSVGRHSAAGPHEAVRLTFAVDAKTGAVSGILALDSSGHAV